jgi:hypothetical protein
VGSALAPGALAAPSAITVTIGSAARRAIPANFLGIALEYSTLTRWMPTAPPPPSPTPSGYVAPVDPALAALIRGLDPAGAPVVRFGGLSTDRTWWPVPGMRKPLGVTFALGPSWVNAARSLAAAAGARYLFGINLLAGSTRLAGYEARQLMGGLGRASVAGWQIGNEPNLYPSLPWYKRSGGQILPWYSTTGIPVFARPRYYGPDQYAAEVRRFLPVLPGGVPVSGPETSNPAWLAAVSGLLGHSALKILTSHAYGTNACVTDPNSSLFPSPAHQLSSVASRGLLNGLTRYVAAAHRHGDTYLVDEMGPASCNGARGVSDTMVGALWELDALFSLAASGVDGVDLHTFPGNLNALWDIARHGGRFTATAHPLYYAALLFAGHRRRLAPAGRRRHLHVAAGLGHREPRPLAPGGPDQRRQLRADRQRPALRGTGPRRGPDRAAGGSGRRERAPRDAGRRHRRR